MAQHRIANVIRDEDVIFTDPRDSVCSRADNKLFDIRNFKIKKRKRKLRAEITSEPTQVTNTLHEFLTSRK